MSTFTFDDLSPVCKDAAHILFDNKEAHLYTFLRTNAIGQKSMYARVYMALQNNATPLIVKCIKLDTSSFTKNDLKDEVKMHRRYASIGLAPKLHQAFICSQDDVGEVGYLVMDMKEMTIKELCIVYLKQISHLFLDTLRDQILQRVATAHANGWCHNDLHLNNVMIDTPPIACHLLLLWNTNPRAQLASLSTSCMHFLTTLRLTNALTKTIDDVMMRMMRRKNTLISFFHMHTIQLIDFGKAERLYDDEDCDDNIMISHLLSKDAIQSSFSHVAFV